MRRTFAILIWVALLSAIAVPIVAALMSPLLAWRSPVYIASGIAGVFALVFLLLQPLLVGGFLPGLKIAGARNAHRGIGMLLVLAVLVHVLGLWITSPPDVIDALLFASPTPFSAWGVIAMWAVFCAAFLAAIRRSLRLSPRRWRMAHTALALVTVVGSIVHATLIEGTMETVSKLVLCALVLVATLMAMRGLKVWSVGKR